jgi:hypothetical protein
MNHDERNDRNQAENSLTAAGTGSVKGQTVQGAPFPHVDIPADASDGRNADRKPRAPQGPLRGPLSPTTRSTQPDAKEINP